MLRYAITHRALFSGDDVQQQAALLDQCAHWAADGIDWIQLREKDLRTGDLAHLAHEIMEILHAANSTTKLLINSRPDVAVATSAHGVHLTSAPGELKPIQIRLLYAEACLPAPAISISTHSLAEVEQARNEQADAILFAPVFEKTVAGQVVAPGQGLDQLRSACAAAAPVKVYALGGVTLENAASCSEAGAAGVAGIRLFHDLSRDSFHDPDHDPALGRQQL
ncbi:MAG: thiamine phosphate synthase [Edaphobacter sp.]